MMFNIDSTKKAKRITIGQYIDKMLQLDYLKKDIELNALKKGVRI